MKSLGIISIGIGISTNHQLGIGIGISMNVQSGIGIGMSPSIGMVQIPIPGIGIHIGQYWYGCLSSIGIGTNHQPGIGIGIGMNFSLVSVSVSVWWYRWNSMNSLV